MEASDLQTVKNSDDILKVSIHYCENFCSDSLLLQPVLCMHVVDAKTNGAYAKKSDSNRAVISYYETQRNDVDYIMPIMTQPCSLSGKKTTILNWEESFILNEKYEHFLKKETDIILFFEVIDLVTISHVKNYYKRLNEHGINKLAWSFLKLLGSNGAVNTGSKLRLQLYKPIKLQKKEKVSNIEVYNWWYKKQRQCLPASLYISVEPHSIVTPNPVLRSTLPFQQEKGSSSFENITEFMKEGINAAEQLTNLSLTNKVTEVVWTRKSGEPCKVPKNLSLRLDVINCCHIIKFSSSGRMLAAGCGSQNCYYILLYEIPGGKLLHKILAHSELIYDLDWSFNDNYLLSASGDYNVKMWRVKIWSIAATFVHPSYVYSAKFHPNSERIIASASYDHIVRLWSVEKCQLLKELKAHISIVCTLCWNSSGTKLFSADGAGQIKIWKKSTLGDIYQLDDEISSEVIKNICINEILLDQKENSLYLFCNDSVVRVLNLLNGSILSSYESDVTCPKLFKGCFSPCGSLLFLSSNGNSISVWEKNLRNKIKVNILHNLNYGGISCFAYHPYDHMLALSFWDDNVPVHVYTYKNDDLCETPVSTKSSSKETNCQNIDSPKTTLAVKTVEISKEFDVKSNNVKNDLYLKNEENYLSSKCISKAGDAHYKMNKMEKGSSSGSVNMFSEILQSPPSLEPHANIVPKIEQWNTSFDEKGSSNISSINVSESQPVVFNRSSKRSKRRKKLRDMYKIP